jgi:Transposase DDE domain
MRLKRVEKFTKAVTKGLLPTQQATLSQVVTGLLACRCLILAEIARCFETAVAFPHNLKRVFRFVSNERLTAQTSKAVVASRLIRQLHHRLRLKPRQYLEVIVDWTSVWPYQVLAALVPLEGRAVPVFEWAVEQWAFPGSQNHYEEQFIRALRRSIPKTWKVVIVADRGFQRVDFLRCLQQHGFRFVVRVKGDAWVESGGYAGPLRDYPLSVGQCFKLSPCTYHKTKRYPLKLALTCAQIDGKVSSWLLATDLGLTAGQIVALYRRRFWCEESFRDQKQEFRLEQVRVKQAGRLENLLLALSIVLLLLAVIGMRGQKLGYADKFAVPKKKQTVLSWVQIALHLLRQSTKYLNLLFDNQAGCFSFHWA